MSTQSVSTRSVTTLAEAPARDRSAGASGGPSGGSGTDAPIGSAGWTGQAVARVRLALAMLVYRATCFLLNHMGPFRLFFAALRRIRPVALIGNFLWVTRAEDVREVLARFEDFQLGQVIEPGMPWGTFMMTIDWRSQHALERGLLQSMVKPEDTALIRSLAAAEVARHLETASGRIDVVAELAEPVAVRIAADYFGIALADPRRMADLMADLAGIIMVNPPVGSESWSRSRASIAELTQAVVGRIAAHEDAAAPAGAAADDLLARLVRRKAEDHAPAWLDDDWIRRYLTGLVGTGGATIVRASAHAIDQLLAHPDGLKLARDAAARLALDAADAAAAAHLRQAIYEALRFRPMLPLLVRDCPRDTVIAAGTPRARLVKGGTRVMAPPLAAMWDPAAVPAPSVFCADRSQDAYLLFGHGARACFGRYIADIALFEIVRAVARLPKLARAGGRDGDVGYQGPAARSLTVTFDRGGTA